MYVRFFRLENLRTYGQVVIVVGISLWGIAEAGYGLLQVLGWRSSRHALYALTGHFQNPGPFGGFIACVMAVAGAWLLRYSRARPAGSSVLSVVSRITTALAWVALAAGLLVLPASMSRAGWLGLAIALGVEWLRVQPERQGSGGAFARVGSGAAERSPIAPPGSLPSGKRSRAQRIVIVFAAGQALLVGAFLLKPDSALGRLHVWRMESRAIAQQPLRGAGAGMGPWAYGEAQEAFFREHLATASQATVRVAGCPDHAYNEYLGLGVEYGLPALLLFISLIASSIAVLHKARSPLAAGLTAWAVFACASYPLAVPQLRILGAIFVLCAIVAGVLQTAGCLRLAGLLPGVCALLLAGWVWCCSGRSFDKLKMTGLEEVRGVYAEGYALHQAGRCAESTAVLERGALMSCDPMFEVIMGKNAEALGDFGRAAVLYEKAHYRVPSRLYPLVRLMRLQVRQGRDADALATARQLVLMPVNGRNAGMVRLHGEAQKTLDSLEIMLRR